MHWLENEINILKKKEKIKYLLKGSRFSFKDAFLINESI